MNFISSDVNTSIMHCNVSYHQMSLSFTIRYDVVSATVIELFGQHRHTSFWFQFTVTHVGGKCVQVHVATISITVTEILALLHII